MANLEIIIKCIPMLLTSILIIFNVVNHFKYKKVLGNADKLLQNLIWNMVSCLMGILIVFLAYRDISEGGFVTPIIMGLILLGFFSYMAYLPIYFHLTERGLAD